MAVGKAVAGIGVGLSLVAGICMPFAGLGYGAYLGYTAGAAALGVTNGFGAFLIGCAGAVVGVAAGKVAAVVTIMGGSALSGAAGGVVGAVTMGVKSLASGVAGLFKSKKAAPSQTAKATAKPASSDLGQKKAAGDFASANDNTSTVKAAVSQKLKQSQGWKR